MSFIHNNTTNDRKIQVVEIESRKETKEISCQHCKGEVQIQARTEVTLKDMPDYPETIKLIKYHIHRYQCKKCGKTFNEEPEYDEEPEDNEEPEDDEGRRDDDEYERDWDRKDYIIEDDDDE